MSDDVLPSLDAFRICSVDGCPWHVLLPRTRCSDHDIASNGPEYAETNEGEIVATRHMKTLDEGDDA